MQRQGAEMLVEFLSDIEGSLSKAYPQENEGVTKAPKIKPSMGILDWQKTKVEVSYLIRRFISAELDCE